MITRSKEHVLESTPHLDAFKARQRAIWDAGDYRSLSPLIADVGELVVAQAGVSPGMQVLDVACGTGNAAFPGHRLRDSH